MSPRSPSSRRGRPRRSDPPKVDYAEVDRLLVIGEEVVGPDGERCHRYPSVREVAKRFDVAHSLIAKYCREHNCAARRAYGTATIRRGRPKNPSLVPAAVPTPASEEPEDADDEDDEEAAEPLLLPARAAATPPARKPGEPVDRNELDRLLVFGEEIPVPGGSGMVVVYPTQAEIGRRLGISRSEILTYARQHQCDRRRAEVEARVRAKVDQRLVEWRADAIAVTRERKIEIIDAYVEAFYEALKEGRVRTDSVTDFNTMIRLKSFLEGDADHRTEILGGLTLDDLRSSHADFLRDRGQDSAATIGVVDAELVAPAEIASPENAHSK